jgi:hypothetical protein
LLVVGQDPSEALFVLAVDEHVHTMSGAGVSWWERRGWRALAAVFGYARVRLAEDAS